MTSEMDIIGASGIVLLSVVFVVSFFLGSKGRRECVFCKEVLGSVNMYDVGYGVMSCKPCYRAKKKEERIEDMERAEIWKKRRNKLLNLQESSK